MADWIIRKAKVTDAARLAACFDAAYSVYDGRGLDLPPVSEGIADDIRDNDVWVAVLGERIVAGLVLVNKDDHLALANVAVDPSARGLGLGRRLMELAEQKAREAGLAKLKLTTHAGIPENVRLYEHLGWRETGRTGNKVMMEKTIA